MHGAPSGDLYVQVHVKDHPIFVRDGNNLACEVPISFSIAALGGEIDVPTLDGRVKLKIPAETQTDKMFRLRGKGVQSVRGGGVGDLVCKVVVETPVNLSENKKTCCVSSMKAGAAMVKRPTDPNRKASSMV